MKEDHEVFSRWLPRNKIDFNLNDIKYILVDGQLTRRKSHLVADLLAFVLIVSLVCGAIALVVAVYGPHLS